MTMPRTPARSLDPVITTPESDRSLDRGFVATLRWLVSEGDARGVRRIAVELRALREALAALDETRAARDERVRRNTELDRELQSALALLGPATAMSGTGTLAQRLMKLRERLAEDSATRRQLTLERDAWRVMCTLLTHTRASAQELLERAESERDALMAQLEVLQERVMELTAMHDEAAAEAQATKNELAQLREQLRHWSGVVERALAELAHGAREISD
ncbi:MAG: hypothetical protein ACOVSI_00570 [Gemmatimonas sp.]